MAPSPNSKPPGMNPIAGFAACTFAEMVYCCPGVSVKLINWCMFSKFQPPDHRVPLAAVTPVKTLAKVGRSPLPPVWSQVSKEMNELPGPVLLHGAGSSA